MLNLSVVSNLGSYICVSASPSDDTGANRYDAKSSTRRAQCEVILWTRRSVDLGSKKLGSVNLGPASLGSANLGLANLGSANLGPANLDSTNLASANLGSAHLRSANLGSATLALLAWAQLT